MKIAIIAITRGAFDLGRTLEAELPGTTLLPKTTVMKTFAENWQSFDAFICIMATGSVVRSIAPLLVDKRTDPCVIVVDEKGRHAISLLSGHLGGGNDLSITVAGILGGEPVITTASDTIGLAALDVWAAEQQLTAPRKDMTRACGILVNKGELQVYSDLEVQSLPSGLVQCDTPEQADILITNRSCFTDRLVFCPQNLVVGTGCNRNTPAHEFTEALDELFSDLGLSPAAIKNLASIDKKNDEEGLLTFAEQNHYPIDFFTKDEINRVTGVEISAAPLKAVGAIGVAEPCAILSAGKNNKQPPTLISRKRKWQNITMAVAELPFTLSAQEPDQSSN